MSITEQPQHERPNPWIGSAPPSPAGPLTDALDLPEPPYVTLPRAVQITRFSLRQLAFVFRYQRRYGDVFRMRGTIRNDPVITAHPDHVRSLFTAKGDQAVSITGESPLRPILGPNSVLTANGARHMRQRKLLLPPFHGEAVERYVQMIADVAEHEIDRWPVDKPFSLAPRMQAITLDVIMSGIFGIDGRPAVGTAEHSLRVAIKQLIAASTMPLAQVAELMNIGRDEPVGLLRGGIAILDRCTYAVIAARRRDEHLAERGDILSLLLQATTEEGEQLTDEELRSELLTLVLAGHETTANALAWTFERLLRTPHAYERLRAAVRDEAEDADAVIEATIVEGMRNRPVIPIIGRRVNVPWRLGDCAVPADTPIAMSILLVHHREDLYPDPFAFRPERFIDHKPGTYEWIPFGGGIRRCLGASLAMAEQRVVLRSIMRRCDLEAPDPEPERVVHRNVTMIPAKGARVVLRHRRS